MMDNSSMIIMNWLD